MLALTSSSAQTLFTYGKEGVSADEFVKAFKKNNNGAVTEKAIKEYLDLYIASRLKIKEAREKGYDTLPQLRTDLLNLRQQILPTYLNDKESLDRLVKEAFERSQKDIRVEHIFIAFAKNGSYSIEAADKRKTEALELLTKKGASFSDVAKQYSDDPSVVKNGGDLGWVTAFSLPYELETVVYSTVAGKSPSVYTSKVGHHIFKTTGERKALGRMKAAQILLAFPPGATAADKARLKKRADSLYTRLQSGADFGKMATEVSNDVVSAASNGQMGEFGVGDYSPEFEAAAFGLKTDGAIGKPFTTEHGYHIIKRTKLLPIPAKLDGAAADEWQRKVEGSDRMLVSRKQLAEKVAKQVGYKKTLSNESDLWMFSDSVFNNRKPSTPLAINPSTALMQLGNEVISTKDWVSYAQGNRLKQNGAVKPYQQLWDEFVQASALRYYQDHLEDFNEDFRRQITEFADGNLFFEIMQQKVWTPAQTDTTALLNYFNAHKDQYVWKESANAVIFYAANVEAANNFRKAWKSPADWKSVVEKYSEQITADSGRFELSQLPKGKQAKAFSKGTVTENEVNPTDNTVAFAYVIQLYKQQEPRSFNDAKGLVISDYQTELEKAWLAELKKKYPVSVNEKVWNELAKGLK